MRSKDNLLEVLEAYAGTHPEVNPDIIIPRRENMERLLKELSAAERD